jgi:VWFA-related protein
MATRCCYVGPMRIRALGVTAMMFSVLAIAALAGAPAAVQQPPRLRSSVQMLEVDVRVFDRDGRFVYDLTAEDFEILEDGTRQRIEVIYLVGARPGAGATASPTPSVRVVPHAPQTWIFVFDDQHLLPNGFDRAKRALHAFLSDRFRPGDFGGIVMRDRMVDNRISTVRSDLVAALDKIKMPNAARSRLADETEARQTGGAGEAGATIRELLTRRNDDGRFRAARAAVETLDELANGLTRMAGLKTIVLFSDGFPRAKLEGTLRTAVGRMNRAGARVYAVDTRGLAGPPTDTINSLAVDTGGLVIFNENNIGRALDEIATDTGVYYVLGYQPANTRYDGKYRRIDVRVQRPDVRVRARKGYLAIDPSRMRPPRE